MNKTEEKGLLVVQSNDLIEAFYDSDLTPTEHKLLRYSAGKLKNQPDAFPVVRFTVSEFLRACGVSTNSFKSKIEKIADELSRKRIKIKNEDQIGWFPWLSSFVYKEGTIIISFNTVLKPLLLNLEGSFTQYNYKFIGDMKSGYTIRLFEILKQYAAIGKRRIKVETLKQMLGIQDKYKKYAQFKLRVLKQAQKELEQKKGLTFTFEEIMENRKVVELIFYIKTTGSSVPKNITPFIREARYLLESYSLKISDEKLREWSDFGIDLLAEALEEYEKQNRSQTIYSPVNYLETILMSIYEKQVKLMSDLIAESEQAKLLIAQYIRHEMSINHKSLLPDWLIESRFENYSRGKIEYEEIEKLWEMNGDYIASLINSNIKKVTYT